MALTSGTRIGPYEVVSPLGAGGMGEVYRARDAKLQREVAIKVLPEHLANDRERLARFEREAQVLASLNHPHIAQIYGFEASGSARMRSCWSWSKARRWRSRISTSGPMPLDEALPIARQIAQALEAAHEQGIVHRDLKPANIKITPDGVVKVLDFGLAKLADLGSRIGQPFVAHDLADADVAGDDRRGDDPRHRGVYGSRTGQGARRRTSAATSGHSAACCSKCSPGAARSRATTSRTRWRRY